MSPDYPGHAPICPDSTEPAEPVPSTAVAVYRPPHVRRPRRVARSRIARLVAEGCSTAQIAQEVGYSRQHVWRLLRKSIPLARTIDDADAHVDFDTTGRLLGIRPIVADELARRASEGNVRVLLWLADKLKVADVSATIKSRAEMMKSTRGR